VRLSVSGKDDGMDLSGVGIWSSQLRYGNADEATDAAAELEELGFSALWIPDVGGPVLDCVDNLLASTKHVVIATGILNLWMHDPSDVAAGYASLTKTHGERPVPVVNRVLAALGPKMLELSATRSRGAHPYLVMPDHTHQAREVLGSGPLLLPEQTVFLTNSRDDARAIGTDWLRAYLALPNYANNLLRSGFTQDDLDSVSDRLFDAIIAWGDEDAIAQRVNEHKQAGADHVCVQALTADPREFPREQWRTLAAAFV